MASPRGAWRRCEWAVFVLCREALQKTVTGQIERPEIVQMAIPGIGQVEGPESLERKDPEAD
jgi:hypothetical protein